MSTGTHNTYKSEDAEKFQYIQQSTGSPLLEFRRPQLQNPSYKQDLRYEIMQRLRNGENSFITQKLQVSAQHQCSTIQP